MVAFMALLGLPLSDRMEELMTNEPLAMETLGLWQEAESASEVIPEWREGYIGIDSNGNLSLFDGPPKQEKVIRTFFQLDVETMESALPSEVLNQLQAGIRIQDVDEYNSVLSTFSDYALPESDQMLQQKQ